MGTHPLQPLEIAKDGVVRFKANKIVSKILEVSSANGCSLNDLARMDFSHEDWQQLRQLIGYSHSGIPNMDVESWEAAEAVFKSGISELQARYNHLRDELAALKKALRIPIARLYEIHPDDLKP